MLGTVSLDVDARKAVGAVRVPGQAGGSIASALWNTLRGFQRACGISS
jgi:hypothetical protein